MLPQAVQPALCGSGCGVVLKLSPEQGEKPMCPRAAFTPHSRRPGGATARTVYHRGVSHIYISYVRPSTRNKVRSCILCIVTL